MTPKPIWLPEMIDVNGEWNETLARLFSIFEQDFITKKCQFENREVWWDRRKLDDNYDEGFWHLISKIDQATNYRLPDFRRAERLLWCGPTITNSSDQAVKYWDYLEGNGRIRTYLWLEHWDYVIVLEKRRQRIREVAFLITAFYVEGNSTRRNLSKKYNRRIV